ncbi:MAG: Coenzyme F420 hydrogenase/dehydrogenase, beta subunit C-terminal domain, partial [Thermodesulfobacteriota bacterium]|nr:Coenzyme F420 hydrogenase/dehydrogenase, beta subunit C-terminal domain [Thermodesulfobacteriota bacterium]
MRIFGPKELLKDVRERGLCVECGACVNLCPYFKTHRGKTAMVFPCDLPEGRCYAYCPKAEVDLDELSMNRWGQLYDIMPLGNYIKALKTRAGKKAPAGEFQAGGTVSSIIAFAMKKGIIEASVLTDREGLTPVPRLVTRTEDVIKCAQSKYTTAPTLEALNIAMHEGQGKLGVVGTPCQVTALTQLRSNPLNIPDFSDPVSLVVGLFCTWALDARRLESMLSKRLNIKNIKKMDIPPPPAEILIVETEKKKIKIPLDEIRPLISEGCLICSDMTSEWSDISVGVLENEPEWNTLIVRSELGFKIIERAVMEDWLITERLPEESLEHLKIVAGNKKRRALTKAIKDKLLNSHG